METGLKTYNNEAEHRFRTIVDDVEDKGDPYVDQAAHADETWPPEMQNRGTNER